MLCAVKAQSKCSEMIAVVIAPSFRSYRPGSGSSNLSASRDICRRMLRLRRFRKRCNEPKTSAALRLGEPTVFNQKRWVVPLQVTMRLPTTSLLPPNHTARFCRIPDFIHLIPHSPNPFSITSRSPFTTKARGQIKC